MAWKQLAKFKLTNDWQFTPAIEGNYFKLIYSNVPVLYNGWICQAEVQPDKSVFCFNTQPILAKSTIEIAEFVKPTFFSSRCIGIRQELRATNNWTVNIEVSDVMPIWNPSGPATPVTSSTVNTTSVPVSTTSVLLIAANTNRIEALIYNTSTKSTLYLGYGTAATVGGSVPIAPGGYFELPVDYTGAINGIWNVVDAAGAAKVVEFVI